MNANELANELEIGTADLDQMKQAANMLRQLQAENEALRENIKWLQASEMITSNNQ